MSRPRVGFTAKSSNRKTGPIPVTTTQADTCPPSCPLMTNGCYAKGGPIAIYWRKVSDGRAGLPWEDFLVKVESLKANTLWRHNQSGDLPGTGDLIDEEAMSELVEANKGKRGFTYTHKPPSLADNARIIKEANDKGFTVNLSANNLKHADDLVDLDIGPVVTILDANQMTNTKTPKGRTITICPAVTHADATCSNCGLCSVASSTRSIVGFPAHGNSKKKVSAIAGGGI